MRYKGQKYSQGIVIQRADFGSPVQEIVKGTIDEMGFITGNLVSGMKAVLATTTVEKGAPIKVDQLPDPNCEYEGRIYIMDDKYYICLENTQSGNYYWVEMATTSDVPEEVTTVSELVEKVQEGGAVALLSDMSYNGTLNVTKNTVLDLNNRMIQSNNNSGVAVTDGGSLTVNGPGEVKARESAIFAMRGGKITVNGGTFDTVDNFVLGTNGSAGVGNNEIVVNDGEFNGNIVTDKYIACGVYVANNDNVTLNGGTFNIINGIGVLARSGHVTIGPDVVFNISNPDLAKGWVGDSKIEVPTEFPIVLDLAANYPGGTPTIENNSSYTMVMLVNALPAASEEYCKDNLLAYVINEGYWACKLNEEGQYEWINQVV